MIAYVPDLMDRSRLGGLAGVKFVSAVDAVSGASDGEIVIVDLGRPGALDAAAAAARSGARVIGFAAHVDDTLLAAASSAGIEAMPRSQFFRQAAELVS